MANGWNLGAQTVSVINSPQSATHSISKSILTLSPPPCRAHALSAARLRVIIDLEMESAVSALSVSMETQEGKHKTMGVQVEQGDVGTRMPTVASSRP